MKIKSVSYAFIRFLIVINFLYLFQSCSNRGAYNNTPLDNEALVNPASRVEKLWLARTQYDSDRRLIIPKVGGARWGAVQEYTADGNLVYRDWWVRNVKLEDLEATPDTNIEVLKDPNSNIQPPVLGLGGDNLQENANENTVIIGTEPTDTELSEPNEVDPFAPVTTPVPATGSDDVDPFAPVPVAPNESDPFALPMESTEGAGIPEPDPFAPLPSPF